MTAEALVLGVNVSSSAAPRADPVSDARRAESLGFDFVSVNDHLHGRKPTYETWTLLTWIAAATSRIRIASRVLAVPYRSPAVLAKMAETLDGLSGGRLILGLGGGSSDEEFHALGLEVRAPREKIEALEEAVQVIRGLWTERAFRFQGTHYRLDGAELEPKPAHRIPIWLGTFGPRALQVTGRVADGWIPSLGYASPAEVVAMRQRVMQTAEEAGRDQKQIACIYNLEVRVEEHGQLGPDVVSGSADTVTARLLEFVELGFTGFNFVPAGPDPSEQIERLAREVVPALRAAFASHAPNSDRTASAPSTNSAGTGREDSASHPRGAMGCASGESWGAHPARHLRNTDRE